MMQWGSTPGALVSLLLGLLAGCAAIDPGPDVATLPADLDPTLRELVLLTRDPRPDPPKIAKTFSRLLEKRGLDPDELLSWSGLSTDLVDVEIWADLLGDSGSRSVGVVLQQGPDLIPGTSALRVLLFGTDGALLDRMDFQAGRQEARLLSAFMETEEGMALVGIGSLLGSSGKPEKLDIHHAGRTATLLPDGQEITAKKFAWICLAEARAGELRLLLPDKQ